MKPIINEFINSSILNYLYLSITDSFENFIQYINNILNCLFFLYKERIFYKYHELILLFILLTSFYLLLNKFTTKYINSNNIKQKIENKQYNATINKSIINKLTDFKDLDLINNRKDEFNIIENYSDKSFVIYGSDTQKHKLILKKINGKFNTHLNCNNVRIIGWVFSNKKINDIIKYCKDNNIVLKYLN